MKANCHILILTLTVVITAGLGAAASELEALGENTPPQTETTGKGTPVEGRNLGDHRKGATAPSALTILAALDEAGRNNAFIELEATRSDSVPFGLPGPADVAALWNEGRFNEALLALQQLDSAGFSYIPAISWKVPIVSEQPRVYQDVRIGGVAPARKSSISTTTPGIHDLGSIGGSIIGP